MGRDSASSAQRKGQAAWYFVILLLALCATGVVFLRGCGRGRNTTVTLPPDPDQTPPPVSKTIDVHFYLDASGSMQGFLATPRAGQRNYFKDVLDKAGNILSESWDASVSYWRFGAGEPQSIDADGLRRFKEASAFTDQSTRIEKAIGHSGHNRKEPPPDDRHLVKVIVTDLWQDRGEAGDLAELFDNAYLTKEHFAVGVVGIRNAFEGKLDLPGHPKDAADSLPFYFLIAGHTSDVRFAIKHLVEDLRIGQKDHFEMVFTRRKAERLIQPLLLEPANPKSGFTQDDRLVPGARERQIPVLRYVRHDLDLNLKGFAEFEHAGSGPHLKMAMHPEVTATAFRKGGGIPDPRAKEALTFSLAEQVSRMKIDRSRLDTDTIYLFQIDLFQIDPAGDRMSNLEAWNLESPDELVNNSFPNDAQGNRPGKTLNLRHFLNVLAVKMFNYKIPLARYYLYVQAK